MVSREGYGTDLLSLGNEQVVSIGAFVKQYTRCKQLAVDWNQVYDETDHVWLLRRKDQYPNSFVLTAICRRCVPNMMCTRIVFPSPKQTTNHISKTVHDMFYRSVWQYVADRPLRPLRVMCKRSLYQKNTWDRTIDYF